MNNTGDIVYDILLEVRKSKKEHPSWPQHVAARAGMVAEKAGELMKAAMYIKYRTDNASDIELKIKARQTAAMAIRLLENL